MAYEPFSLSTRKTRTSLLVFSTLALAITEFDVTLENIPGIGFEIPVPEGLLNFVVGVAVAYLTVAFALYCSDDITYMSRPEGLQDESQRLIEENAQLTARMSEIEREVARDSSLGSRSVTKGRSETKAQGTSSRGTISDISSSKSSGTSVSISETRSFSGLLAELEDAKSKVDRNNELLRRVDITRFTWARIYVFDTALPLMLGLLANLQIWHRAISQLISEN